MPLDRFVYERPVLIDVPKSDRELVRRDELEPHEAAIAEADVLLLRTRLVGDPQIRPGAVRPRRPWRRARCVHLPDRRLPGAEGARSRLHLARRPTRRIDPEGIVAHQILCGVGRGDRYVLIIEDLDLSAYPPGPPPARLYAIPLFPEGTDSSPCTVFAELDR